MMGNAKDILILAKERTRAANLSFLLRLSNCQTIYIDDDIEAFNFLVQRQNSPKPVGLLLVADADQKQPILQLLDELEQRNAMLPILLLRDKESIPLHDLTRSDRIRARIKQCDSSLTHSCVREMLATFPVPMAKVS